MDTLCQLFHASAKRFPNRVAVHHRGQDCTYRDLWQRACCVAAWLENEGFQPQQRIVVLLPNSVDYVACYVGILLARGIVVALNPDTTPRELSTVFENCQPQGVVYGSQAARHLNDESLATAEFSLAIAAEEFPDALAPAARKTVSLEEILAASAGDVSLAGQASDVAQLIYTSGTSGAPKGVTLSHRNLVANSASIVEYLRLTEDDAVFAILPFFYSYGNSLLVTHLAVGGRLILASDFVFWNRALDLMEQQRASGFAGVPSSYAMLLHKSDFRKRPFADLRYLTCAGGALSPTAISELREAVPHVEIFVMYGQTEATARLSTLMPDQLDRHVGSVGRGIPGVKLTVRNEQGQPAAPGEVGEIVAQGGNIMVGYWNDPDATRAVIKDDGLHTGDLATVDEEGYIYIVGRASEVIKSGAYRISPKEIEEVIAEVAGVAEVAVVGLPDEILGEVPVAFVIATPDAGSTLREDILAYCAENMANYKAVRDVRLVASLPKTSSGKVKKGDLRRQVAQASTGG